MCPSYLTVPVTLVSQRSLSLPSSRSHPLAQLGQQGHFFHRSLIVQWGQILPSLLADLNSQLYPVLLLILGLPEDHALPGNLVVLVFPADQMVLQVHGRHSIQQFQVLLLDQLNQMVQMVLLLLVVLYFPEIRSRQLILFLHWIQMVQ